MAARPKPTAAKAGKAPAKPKPRPLKRPPNSLTIADVAKALAATAGILTPAARRLGVDRTTLWRFTQKHPEEVAEAKLAAKEHALDVAETKLVEGINRGEFPFVRFYLESQGKERGYGKQLEVSGPKGGAIQLDVSVKLEGLSDEQIAALASIRLPGE
jgi:transcriptional regulator with XRE-family HTH domain